GVTAINGTGMYTKKGHYILMVAVTVTEIAELKRIVQKADPKVFIVVNPAQEIFGGGFQPLEEQEDNIR
ncbi:MAG: YitT family protein, partial [Chloroflexota bacterium]